MFIVAFCVMINLQLTLVINFSYLESLVDIYIYIYIYIYIWYIGIGRWIYDGLFYIKKAIDIM